MDPITQQVVLAAAGAAASETVTYVDDVFSTFLYEATGATTQTITNGIDLNGEGGMVWQKNRDNATSFTNHTIVDSERIGSYGHKSVYPNLEDGEFNPTAASNAVATSFNSDGFTKGGNNNLSTSGADNVSWTFRKAPGFFDVVTYTGDSTSGRNISHNLGSVPGMILIKRTNGSTSWAVYHRSLGAGHFLTLNENSAKEASSDVFGNTTPTSTVFTVGNHGRTNSNNDTYVAYIFAHDDQSFGADSDEAIIKCGSYTGNNNSDGPEVDLGFEPQFIIHKRADNADNWLMLDNMRDFFTNNVFYINTNNNEADFGTSVIRHTSTGFKITTTNSQFNGNNETYVYMAIRRPHKPPTAGTDVYATDVGSSSSVIPTWDSGFPIDFALARTVSGTNNWWTISRLTGTGLLQTHTTTQEVDGGINWVADSNVGWGKAYSSANRSWMFKRAPGFFDVVAYRGSNSSGSTSYTHNLEVVPELMVIKCRNAGGVWYVYSSATGSSKYLSLSGTNAEGNLTWTTPTATEFTAFAGVNATHEDYIVYLFATLDGISKVGSYTGTGGNINVDCGFTAGARFVLIKRRDSTGDWYVWDTARGIVSGNDPYLLINSTAGEVTNTDYIDPLNAGFTVTSSAPAALNTSGGTYLFLAIA